MDDLGRMFCTAAGSEKLAYGFQQHSSYGALALPGETDPSFDEVFPALQTLDLQGGWGRIDACWRWHWNDWLCLANVKSIWPSSALRDRQRDRGAFSPNSTRFN